MATYQYQRRRTSSFAEYFKSWEAQHMFYHDKLLAHQNQNEEEVEDEESLRHLIEQVLCHYQEYYDEKSRAAESDVLLMFSPPWFSSFERTLLWITGFKPSVTFELVKETVGGDLSEEQKQRIAEVRKETHRVEREMELAMANVQEGVAAPPLCGLLKAGGSLVDGQVSDLENAVAELKTGMLGVMRDADNLRQHTAGQVLEVLSPPQKLRFLVGTSQFWLQSRRLGMDRDRQMRSINYQNPFQ